MTIALPTSPHPRGMAVRPVSFVNDITPLIGGPALRLARLGDRWEIEFELPPMAYETAMAWVSRLNRARTELVSMVVPQPGYCMRGRPGAPLVKGAGQAGASLNTDGWTHNFAVMEGQWVSLTSGGRSYLHQITAETRADALGELSLALDPMLRISPADNSPLEVTDPVIEGFLTSGREWSVDAAHHVGLTFTITERE